MKLLNIRSIGEGDSRREVCKKCNKERRQHSRAGYCPPSSVAFEGSGQFVTFPRIKRKGVK